METRRPSLFRSMAELEFWLQGVRKVEVTLVMLKDTSIRLTITLQVSMLKPSVLMSVPVKKRQEVEAEQVNRCVEASALTYVWRQSCSGSSGAPPQRSACPETQQEHHTWLLSTPHVWWCQRWRDDDVIWQTCSRNSFNRREKKTYISGEFGEEVSESCVHLLIRHQLLNTTITFTHTGTLWHHHHQVIRSSSPHNVYIFCPQNVWKQ